jgi:uncharacterized spore protein YtfJ
MDVDALLAHTWDTVSVKRVFGEPIERDGTLVIPVAVVFGGGGGGGNDAQGGDEPGSAGAGFGVWARPIGVYVVRDGNVTFRPALDVAALVLCGTLLLAPLLLGRRRRR